MSNGLLVQAGIPVRLSRQMSSLELGWLLTSCLNGLVASVDVHPDPSKDAVADSSCDCAGLDSWYGTRTLLSRVTRTTVWSYCSLVLARSKRENGRLAAFDTSSIHSILPSINTLSSSYSSLRFHRTARTATCFRPATRRRSMC